MTGKGQRHDRRGSRRRHLLVAATALLVGSVLVGGKALLPASAQLQDPTASPLPIRYIVEIRDPDTGRRTLLYASELGFEFPASGEFVYTRWRTHDGGIDYKARIKLTPLQLTPTTDHAPHDPGDGDGR